MRLLYPGGVRHSTGRAALLGVPFRERKRGKEGGHEDGGERRGRFEPTHARGEYQTGADRQPSEQVELRNPVWGKETKVAVGNVEGIVCLRKDWMGLVRYSGASAGCGARPADCAATFAGER